MLTGKSSKKKEEAKMEDQFRRYEKDLVELIKSAKTKLADQIPIAERGKMSQIKSTYIILRYRIIINLKLFLFKF